MGRDVAMLAQVLHTTLRATGSEAAGTAGSEPLTTRKRAYAAELRAQSAERRDQRAPGGASGGSGVPTVPQLCPSAAAGADAGRKVSRVLETVGGGNPPPEAGPLPGNDQGMAQRRGGVESRILRVLRRPLADGAVVALASVFALGTLSAPAQSSKTEVRVGALLSITGAGSSLGNTSRAALEVAVKRLNHQLKNAHVTLDIVDTGQDPDRAKAGFDKLAGEGVKLIIGPQSSSEVAAIMDAANQRGVLVVSQGSTASSLGIPNDMIFRFVPTDHVEGRATVDLIKNDGKKTIVPLWRNDRGNQGLADSVRAAATAEGITVTDGFRYAPNTTDFGAALQAVAQQVAKAGGDTAVYLAGFEEVADVLAAAGSVQGLDQATWYGGDGSAQAKQLVDDAQAVAFAEKTGSFPSPLVALPKGAENRHHALLKQITRRAKATVDAFGLAAYDAVRVGVRALVAAGANADAAALRSAFTNAADDYKGITGKIELDQNGDRASAPYAFWSICFKKSPAWHRTGTWTPGADPTGPGRTTVTGCPKTKT